MATLGAYLVWLVPQLLWMNDQGVWVGQLHLWSDWPWHIAMMQQLADGVWVNPLIAGEPLRYPFAMAYLSALFLKLGADVSQAFLWPMIPLFLLLLMGMHRFWTHILRNPWWALGPIFLFFLSAGPGFLHWFADIKLQGLEALLHPPQEYGSAPEEWGYQWYASNYLVGMLLPQRAFLPGMTWMIWLLCALQVAHQRRQWLMIGLAAGFLPLVHMHSFVALLFLGSALLWPHRHQWRQWMLAFIPGGVLAMVNYGVFLHADTPYPDFIQLKIGYQADSLAKWCLMWWRFWGFALLFSCLGYFCLPKGPARTLVIAASALFVLANVLLFQPIAWDNSKLFLWSYFGFSGAMTALLMYCWQKNALAKILSVVCLVLLTLTGAIELLRLAQVERNSWMIISENDRLIAEQIRQRTPAGSVFLTGMDVSNTALWAGRPIFLGFGGWMANFGFNHHQREADLKSMFAGDQNARTLLQQWGIDYVLIGDHERSQYAANEAWFSAHFPVWIQGGNTRIYQVNRQ